MAGLLLLFLVPLFTRLGLGEFVFFLVILWLVAAFGLDSY